MILYSCGFLCPLFYCKFLHGGASIKELQINEEIRDKEVRLVDDEGNQVGVVPRSRALDMAFEKKLDLVNVSPNSKPPVCRIMDYGKYKYEMIKKERDSKKKQRVINIKEVRLTPNIEKHDLETKVKHAKKFLSNGDRVKVAVRFRGREMGHTEIGKEVLDRFVEMVSESGTVDKKPKLEGRNMIMFLAPNKEEN
ncbi:Translation initiation factor IF-3 [Peptoniphilus indolicus]|uniref:Translation initiation factor IF-3 n=1 Tax=Peptoniphilus indolicus TaxID=33030 RepID=A0A379DE60_9FIRM|nr:Translation initiation factor IF-3 [Peptoniphilus indolicus]